MGRMVKASAGIEPGQEDRVLSWAIDKLTPAGGLPSLRMRPSGTIHVALSLTAPPHVAL